MKNPRDIANDIIAKWRTIPEVLTEMDGEAANIFSYDEKFPTESMVFKRIFGMSHPSIMLVWDASGPFEFGVQHDFTAFVRCREILPADTIGGYPDIWHALIAGKPNSGTIRMLESDIGGPELSIAGVPSAERLTDDEGMDYFAIHLVVLEQGIGI